MKKVGSNFVRLIIWLGFIGLFSCMAMVIWTFFPNQSSVVSLKWLQFIQTICVFLLPPILLAWLSSARPLQWLHLDKGMSGYTAIMAVVIMVCAVPGINLLSYLNQQLDLPPFLQSFEERMRFQEDAAKQLTEQFLSTETIEGLLINIGLMALLPAIAEELSFRGILQSFLLPMNEQRSMQKGIIYSFRTHLAVWITAAIFSFVHFQFYGFIPRMLMGAMFGYMALWSGSLWVPMLMHFVNNAIVVVSYFILNWYHVSANSIDSIGTSSTLWVGVVSIILVVVWMWYMPRLLCFVGKEHG